MRYITAIAALVSVAAAGDAPAVQNNPIGITYAANLPNTGAHGITGAVKGSASPDGKGTNIQVSLYNVPSSGGNISYSIHTGRVSQNGDCSGTGGVLDPFAGVTGGQCSTNLAGCQLGDLSDKRGGVTISSGGAGTGFVVDNYVDAYLSMKPGGQAFFGNGSFVINDANGGILACANFKDANAVASTASDSSASASTSVASMTTSATAASSSASASSTTSGSGAMRTAVSGVGAAMLGLAGALLL